MGSGTGSTCVEPVTMYLRRGGHHGYPLATSRALMRQRKLPDGLPRCSEADGKSVGRPNKTDPAELLPSTESLGNLRPFPAKWKPRNDRFFRRCGKCRSEA
jgi:hypothetical protein